MEELGTKRTKREVIEEHITVLAEPGSKYLGHFSPSSGTAKNMANSLINKIQAIECDGTTQTLVGKRE